MYYVCATNNFYELSSTAFKGFKEAGPAVQLENQDFINDFYIILIDYSQALFDLSLILL